MNKLKEKILRTLKFNREGKSKLEVFDGVVNSNTIEVSYITKKDMVAFTKTVPVPDVKTYLLKEYERAFEREEKISNLEQEIDNYKKIETEYNAMLIVQDKREERYAKQEEKLKELKQQKTCLETEIKLLETKLSDLTTNHKKIVSENKTTIEKLQKNVDKITNEKLKNYKAELIEKIINEKGVLSKNKICDFIKNIC